VKSYELCGQGEFEHVERLERVYEGLRRRPRQEIKIQVEEEDDGGSESEGEEMQEEADNATTNGGDGKDEQGMEVDNGPVVDEDGFQLVQGKGRRRGR
jgi:pre-rRNA-processing protein TSR2